VRSGQPRAITQLHRRTRLSGETRRGRLDPLGPAVGRQEGHQGHQHGGEGTGVRAQPQGQTGAQVTVRAVRGEHGRLHAQDPDRGRLHLHKLRI